MGNPDFGIVDWRSDWMCNRIDYCKLRKCKQQRELSFERIWGIAPFLFSIERSEMVIKFAVKS